MLRSGIIIKIGSCPIKVTIKLVHAPRKVTIKLVHVPRKVTIKIGLNPKNRLGLIPECEYNDFRIQS